MDDDIHMVDLLGFEGFPQGPCQVEDCHQPSVDGVLCRAHEAELIAEEDRLNRVGLP